MYTVKPPQLPELSVVIPVHNEVENIGKLVAEIQAALTGGAAFEIVTVNDGSSDATLDVLTGLQERVQELRVVSHENCCGQSTALRTGVAAARGKYIATLDGDGQNDPADIPHLWQRLQELNKSEGVRMVAGYRKGRRDTAWRRFCSRVANGVRSRILRDATPDTGCGLKVFDRAVFMDLPYFDHMHRFLPALVRRHGAGVVSVEVNHRPRKGGRSHYGTWDRFSAGVIDLMGVLWLLQRTRLPVSVEYFKDEHGHGMADDRTGGAATVHSTVSRAVA
ncbi:MAG: glycosyltransferase family 2 protein [Pirellulaceae bacterium]